MKTYEECFPCFERQASEACSLCSLDRQSTADVVNSVRARLSTFPRSHSPVSMAVEIHSLVRSASGNPDPYASVKRQSNKACSEAMPFLTQCMANSPEPFETATKLSIAGNNIDFGVYSPREVSSIDVIQTAWDTLRAPLAGTPIAEFRALIDQAEKILFVGDNAGECFLDTFLLDQLPLARLTYAVRGDNVLNDATQEDARAAGIPERCTTIDTGDCAPGVLLDRCAEPFRQVLNQADLVIAKGQGNYESLSETKGKTCVFLTKIKCPVVARDTGHKKGSNAIRIINGPHEVNNQAGMAGL